MISLNKKSLAKRSQGFTIVELLIVIVIIGILATLVIVTFTGIQKKARDSQRQTDINALDSHVESFYAQYGYYPTLADLQSSSFQTSYLKGLDPEALKDPKGGTIQAATDATHYGYTATGASGCANTTVSDPTGASTTNNGCDGFTVKATLEGDPSNPYTKKSN